MEMDTERMTPLLFSALPTWAAPIGLAAHLGAGMALGVLYFRSLWDNVDRLTHGGRLLPTIVMAIGRFAILGGLMTLVSLEGAQPLLMLSLGVLVGRSVVMRRDRKATP
jgi:F1F0 ATPase subunit 2